MDEILTREEVLHVADLAKIRIKEEEMEKYQKELKIIFNDIEKINEVEGYDDDIIIAPFSSEARLRDDEVERHIEIESTLKNVPRHSGNYIEVPVVINE